MCARKIESIEEVHKLQLDLLTFFDQKCKENNLRYFLAGGTLLGAVRHQGFIPWDDDIDVAMPRKDYEKFIEISKDFKNQYKVIAMENTKNAVLPFGKLVNENYSNYRKTLDGKYGIRMDIFPLDGLGNDYEEALKRGKSILFAKKFFTVCFKNNIFSKFLNKLNFQKISYKHLVKKLKKHNFDDSKYVGSIVGGLRKLDEIFEYRIYSENRLMKFEDKEFSGMKYYDEYLKKMYGDYMKLPPKEKQIAEHGVEIYEMKGGI